MKFAAMRRRLGDAPVGSPSWASWRRAIDFSTTLMMRKPWQCASRTPFYTSQDIFNALQIDFGMTQRRNFGLRISYMGSVPTDCLCYFLRATIEKYGLNSGRTRVN